MKRRALTAEEKQLWELITHKDVPLDARHRQIAEPNSNIKYDKFMASPNGQADERHNFMASLPIGYDSSAALSCGAYAGIDRNTSDRFRKGELPIAGVIDLHGMSREKAHIALGGFIRGHYERGSRCLLAITGKGIKNTNQSAERKDMQEQGQHCIVRGVLKEMLPQWLAEPGIKPMVLAFDIAKPKHGGSGAYYILLRRARNG